MSSDGGDGAGRETTSRGIEREARWPEILFKGKMVKCEGSARE